MIRSMLTSNNFRFCRLIVMMPAVFLLAQGLFASASPLSDYYCSFEVVGYYPDYHQNPIPEMRYDLLTGAVFFSIYPNPDGSLNTSEIDLSRQSDFVTAAHAQQVEALVCVGGWGLSGGFSAAAGKTDTRGVFVTHLVTYCLDHDFDGVVLDWEPVSTVTDRGSYTLLIEALKSALSPHGLSLSVAVSAQGSELNPSAIDVIDRLHVMAYDMGTPHSTYADAVAAIDHWEAFGFPPSKLILGLPFYGRDASGSYNAYKDIVDQYHPAPDIDEVNGIYFNGIDTIKKKTRFVIDHQCGGVMFWEITQDSNDATSLLAAISDEIHLRHVPDFNCDGAIDFFDLDYLTARWLMSGCGNGTAWCEASDLDHSGIVTLQDFVVFASFWMENQYGIPE